MLTQIKAFFEEHLMPGAASGAGDDDHRLRLAVAALLLEMTRADEQVSADECAALEDGIRDHFGLTDEDARELIVLADAERREATDYFQFTSLINTHYGPEQRVQIVEQLWRIAYADAALHHYEEHLVRKVAQLLHVPHGAFIAAKLRSGGAA
jgi:uncharacterized tellurite resistance protein B-like protein